VTKIRCIPLHIAATAAHFYCHDCFHKLQSKLHEKSEPILRVSETAGKEFAIESSLNKMRDAWTAVTLQVHYQALKLHNFQHTY
jgi:hypothetical protein